MRSLSQLMVGVPTVRWLLASILLLAPTKGWAAGPEPENAAILGATATLLPIAVGAGLLTIGRGSQEGTRFTAGLTSISIGAIVGPTTGQLYAGGGVDTVVTLLLRTVTGGLAVSGLGLALRGSEEEQTPAIALLSIGGATTLALAIYDIVDAPSTARESRIRASARSGPTHPELYSVAVCGPIPCPDGQWPPPEVGRDRAWVPTVSEGPGL